MFKSCERVHLCGGLCETECSACRGQQEALDPWELELQVLLATGVGTRP